MNSTERRLKIFLLLQSKKKDINASYLSEYFGVSRRTIFRDLNTLKEQLEVPVDYYEGEGYVLPRGFSIPPLMFNPKEISTIMVGLSFVKSQQDAQMIEDAKAVELKIQNVVPSELRNLMNVLDKYLVIDPYLRYGIEKNKGGDWYTIANAIAQNIVLKFNYGSPETRTFHPYLLVYYSDHWNVIGYNTDRKALRNYKIDLIDNLQITRENFVPLEISNNPEKLIFRGDAGAHKIELLVSKEVWTNFKRTLPAEIISYEEKIDEIYCKFDFDNISYINEWLLRFGESVKILQPNSLMDAKKALLVKMLSELR
jgi:predicted DNA-binding transcriptional regulator YafY